MSKKVFTPVPHDQIAREGSKFASSHPNSEWKEYEHTQAQLDFLSTSLRFLINTQNGEGVDDSHLLEGSTIVKRVAPTVVDKDVLVLGAGTGREMKALRECGAKTVSGVTLGNRNQMFAAEVVGESPVVSDVHTLLWPRESFDIVAAMHVLEHAYAPIIFLLGAHRVLRTGGLLAIETPAAKQHSGDAWFHHILCPTPRQLFSLLLKAGFRPSKLVLAEVVIDVLSYATERDLPDSWADASDKTVYFEAVRLAPSEHLRGQLARYYELLKQNGA